MVRWGLPGSQTHAWAVASPGQADETLDEIYHPGPHGPYDTAILTPAEAAAELYQDGTHVYGSTWDEIERREAEESE